MLLILFNTATQASSTNLILLLSSSLGWALLLLVYSLLNRQITERQQAEANFQDLYNNSPCGYHSTNKDGIFIAINDTELSWLGYSRDEVIGKIEITELLTPETAAIFRENFSHFLERGWLKDLELQMIRKDGTTIPVQMSATAITDARGNFIETRTTLCDITERKQALETLRQSQNRFRSAVDNIPDSFVIYDAQQRLQFVNAEGLRRTGLPEEAILGHTDEEIHPPEVTAGYLPTLRRAVQTRTTQTTECTITLPTTGTFTVVVTYVPLLDDRGEISSVLGITHDLTQRKLAEAELQQSEQKFRQLAENIHEVFWMSSADASEILYISPAYEQTWGRSCESLYANPKSFLEAIHPDDREWVRAAGERNVTREFDIEYRIVQPDGTVRWVRDRGLPIRNESGEISRRVGIAQDITLWKQAEAILQQRHEELELRVAERTAQLKQANDRLQAELSERQQMERALSRAYQRLQFHMENTPLAVIEWNCEYRAINWSKQAEKIFGWTFEEVCGNHPQDWSFIHEEDIERVNGVMERLLNGSQANNLSINRNYTKDGRVIHCEWYNSALLDASGNLVSILCLIQDVTERKRAEEALRESEERWQLAVRGSNDGIWDLNLKSDRCFYSVRWKAMLGYDEHEVLNNTPSWAALVHPDDIERVRQARQEHLQRQTPYYIVEYRMRCKDGSYKWILSRAQALWNETGSPVRMVGSHTDISDRKQAEEALREAHAELEQRATELAQANQELHNLLEELQLTQEELYQQNQELALAKLAEGVAREAAEAQRQRYQDLFDFAPHGYLVTDARGRIQEANRATAELLCYDTHSLVGKTLSLFIPRQERKIFRTQLNRLRKQQQVPTSELNLQPFNGEPFPAAITVAGVRDLQGKLVGLRWLIRNISKRKRAEEALRKSQEQLQAILNNSPTVIYLMDAQNRYLLINRRYENLFNVTREQLLGKSTYQNWPREIAEALVANNRKVLEDGMPLEVEEVVPHDDGLHTYITIKFPLHDADGVPYAVCGISTDITERKRTEETLRKQAYIFENIHDGIILTDLEGRIIDWNPRAEKMFGYAKAEVLGKTPRILPKPEESAELTRQIVKEMINVGRWTGELNFICKEGTEGVCETCKGEIQSVCESVVVPLHDERGQLSAAIWVNRDISDRKQAEAALQQAYDELESRVRERTMQLFKANEELQMENTQRQRVEAELKTRARQQAAVAELGQQALAGNDLDRLMNQAVALVAQILEVEYCKVLELLPDGKTVLLRSGVGWQAGLVGQSTVSVEPNSQAGHILFSSEPVIVEDLRKEVRFSGSSLLREHGVVSGISVIIPRQHRPYGVLGAYTTRQRKFTKDDVHFLQATANVLATAIDRQQGEAALRQAHDELEIRVTERTADLAKANLELQQEIAERQQAEAERAKLIAILEATPDIVGHASIDQQLHYLNGAGRKIFGFDENENFPHFTISEAHPDWAYEILSTEGIPTAMRDGTWVGETAFLSHDGREIPVSQLIIAHKSPDGSVNLLSTIARDITQQKKIAATLLQAERRWRSLLENVHLVVVGLDRNGKIEYVNPYFLELVGYAKAEVIGQDWFEMFLPLHRRNQGQNNYWELLQQEFYTHNQNLILTKSGEERVIAWNNTLLKDLHGNAIGTLSIGEDITERQVIERMKDEFISVVSHELRTPLTSIHGALNLLSSGLVNTQSDKGRRVIEIAAESAERLVRLVNDILELERLESGKISLSKQTCNAAELMIKAMDMMQVMANRSGITLSVAPNAIQLDADPDRIIQVLTNLLGNAIKFSPSGSTVWLTVELGNVSNPNHQSPIPNPLVVFKVKDQGRGIPDDMLESIFERFHQVDASDSRNKGGTGLGLAICRSIVQQHGGQIWVESTLGEGSNFYFTLPVPTVEDNNHDNQAHLGD